MKKPSLSKLLDNKTIKALQYEAQPGDPECTVCGEPFPRARRVLGYVVCRQCGELAARQVKHCIVPMPKSNYIVVTDTSLLKGLNSSHKGNK